MSTFAPVTDDDLARARSDPAFRQRLLEQNLELLLAGLRKLRKAAASPRAKAKAGPQQIREGVELAVRLAELIQAPGKRSGPS